VGGRAAGRGLVPVFFTIAVIMCGKRAIDTFSAHDHGAGGPAAGRAAAHGGKEDINYEFMTFRKPRPRNSNLPGQCF
jgi:hypothetical protein